MIIIDDDDDDGDDDYESIQDLIWLLRIITTT